MVTVFLSHFSETLQMWDGAVSTVRSPYENWLAQGKRKKKLQPLQQFFRYELFSSVQ